MNTAAWASLTGGLAIACVGFWRARLSGMFWMRLEVLHEPLYCSVPFLNLVSRIHAYYLPTILLPTVAAWLVPHWTLSLLIAVCTVWSVRAGARDAYLHSLQNQTEYYLGEGETLEQASIKAKRDIDAHVSSAKMRYNIR